MIVYMMVYMIVYIERLYVMASSAVYFYLQSILTAHPVVGGRNPPIIFRIRHPRRLVRRLPPSLGRLPPLGGGTPPLRG